MNLKSLLIFSILSTLSFSTFGGDLGKKSSLPHKEQKSLQRKGGVSSGGGDPEVPDCLKAYEQNPSIGDMLEMIESVCLYRYNRAELECVAHVFDKGYPMSKAVSDCKIQK